MFAAQAWGILIFYFTAALGMSAALFFLPAFVELKKPRDAGPRILSENLGRLALDRLKKPLIDIEGFQSAFSLMSKRNLAWSSIPNIEV